MLWWELTTGKHADIDCCFVVKKTGLFYDAVILEIRAKNYFLLYLKNFFDLTTSELLPGANQRQKISKAQMSNTGKHTRHETRRYRFANEFPAKLLTLDGRSLPGLRPIDVSRRGFGFIINGSISMGAQYWLVVGDKRLKVEVAYCESHLGIDNLFKCGIYTRDPEVDLENLFGSLGLLAELLAIDAA